MNRQSGLAQRSSLREGNGSEGYQRGQVFLEACTSTKNCLKDSLMGSLLQFLSW